MKKKLLALLLVVCMVVSALPVMALAADFQDVDDGHWGKPSIDRWTDVGVLKGKGGGNFDPDGKMTRAEFAQMLVNMMGYTKKAPNTFSDVPNGQWYADAVLKLVAAGVLAGDGHGHAMPESLITREEAAVMLCRAFKLRTTSTTPTFADSGSISPWARAAVATLAEKGMMNGVGGNLAAPLANIDRASVAKLVDNMVAEYVTTSKTITGEVDGIILVTENVTVTIEDATLTAPVVVAPGAPRATVNITGETTAEEVIVDSSATVNVGKDATVEEIALEAPKATANVSGTVETVTVAEGADNASVVANSDAKIENVTTAAENVTVTGSGEVGTVTATDGSVDVNVKDAVVENKGADKVTAGDKTVDPGKSEVVENTVVSGGGGGGGGGTPAPTYDVTITVNTTGSGEVTADSELRFNLTEEEEENGKDVELTITPAAGYIVYEVKVDGETASPTGGGLEKTLTLSGVKTNKIVDVTFIQPITNVELIVVDSVTQFKKLVDNYGFAEDSSLTSDDLAQNAWLAVGVTVNEKLKGEDGSVTDKISTSEMKFLLNGEEITPNKTLTAAGDTEFGKAVTTYIRAHNGDEIDTEAASLFARNKTEGEVSGTYTVKFTYKGVDYSASTDYTAVDESGTAVTMFSVTFTGANPATYKAASGQKVTVPAVPENTSSTYYTGTWTAGESTVNPGDKITVTDAATYTADSKPIVNATTIVRPVEEGDFDYQGAYAAAGIEYKNGKISIDQKEALTLINSEDEDDAAKVAGITVEGVDGKSYLYIGIAVKAPLKDVTKVIVNEDDLDVPSVSGSGTDVYKDSKGDVYYISYYPAIQADGTALAAKSWDPELLVWVKTTGQGSDAVDEIVKVETFTVGRNAATPATYKVTFMDEGAIKSTKTVNYNTAVGTLPTVTKTGYEFVKWVTVDADGTETDFTAATKIAADIVVTAKWLKNPEVEAYGAGFQKTGITGAVDQANKSKITITVTDQWNPNADGGTTGMIGGAGATAAPSGQTADKTLWVGVKIKVSDSEIAAVNGYSWCLYNQDGTPSSTKGTFVDGSTEDGYVIMWVGLAGKNVNAEDDSVFWLVKNSSKNTTDKLGIYKGTVDSGEFVGTVTIQKVFPAPNGTTTTLPEGYE